MSSPVRRVQLVTTAFNSYNNILHSIGVKHPTRQIPQPAPFEVMQPFANLPFQAQEVELALPVVIETFRRLAEAILAFSPVPQPQETLQQEIRQLPTPRELIQIREALIALQREVRGFQATRAQQVFPQQFVQILIQIPVLIEQVERLIERAAPQAIPLQQPSAPVVLRQPEEAPPTPSRPIPQEAITAQTQEIIAKAPQEALPGRVVPSTPETFKEPAVFLLPESTMNAPLPQELPKGFVNPLQQPAEPESPPLVIAQPLKGIIPPPISEEITVPAEEFLRAFPSFVQGLAKAFPFLPQTVPAEFRQALQAYLQRPELQAFLTPLLQPQLPSIKAEAPPTNQLQQPFAPTPLPPEIAAEREIPTRLQPVVVGEQAVPIPSRAIIPEEVRRELAPILRVYPYFIPQVTQEPIPPVIVIPPPLARGIGLSAGAKSAEQSVQTIPPFSTEIPFAFIVPYVTSYPIQTPFPKAKTGKTRAVEEDEKEDEGPEGEKSIQLLSYVPEGTTWYGDPFDEGELDERPLRYISLKRFGIGTYLVTNLQYAEFLTELSKREIISVDNRGRVFSGEGELLCQIKAGNSMSDIETDPRKRYLGFKPTKGKEAYPVTFVSYFGAKAFCDAAGFRLPTEIEWEKAAAVKVDSRKQAEYKFRYGFSKDVIDSSLANYEGTNSTPVGFYNGMNAYTKDGRTLQISNGVSPFGCYDTSGNVWEWVFTENEQKAILKGGSFASSPKELRASARKWEKKDFLDSTIGFRVALS